MKILFRKPVEWLFDAPSCSESIVCEMRTADLGVFSQNWVEILLNMVIGTEGELARKLDQHVVLPFRSEARFQANGGLSFGLDFIC